MKTQNGYQNTPLKCFENCKPAVYTFSEAYKKLWTSNYGWVIPKNWYRWSIGNYTGENRVYKKAQKPGIKLGYLTHIKGLVTIDDAEEKLNGGDELEHDTFVTWACRFNSIFRDIHGKKFPPEFYPFQYIEVPSGIYATRAAYEMYPDRTSFLIIGVDPDSTYDDNQVPWHLLLERPENQL